MQQLHVLTGPDVSTALKHQVLEQVRISLAALVLVARPDVVPKIDRDHPETGIVAREYAESIVESMPVDGVRDVTPGAGRT
jgi:hypothetical protein